MSKPKLNKAQEKRFDKVVGGIVILEKEKEYHSFETIYLSEFTVAGVNKIKQHLADELARERKFKELKDDRGDDSGKYNE